MSAAKVGTAAVGKSQVGVADDSGTRAARLRPSRSEKEAPAKQRRDDLHGTAGSRVPRLNNEIGPGQYE